MMLALVPETPLAGNNAKTSVTSAEEAGASPLLDSQLSRKAENRTNTQAIGPSILLVDDNEISRAVLGRGLERKGYVVCTAGDGADALALLDGFHRFDLVLLDVLMPGIGGMEVLQRIRHSYSPTQLPVIMTTASDDSADIVAALGLGANDYVTKPLDFDVVVAKIRTHLDLKHSVQKVLELEARLTARNVELETANAELRHLAQQRQNELETAARVQAAFLPSSLPRIAGVKFAWRFEPCQELAGDSLNILVLGPEHVAFYVLDVSGHGVAAALLAVAATRLLSAGGDGESILLNKLKRGCVVEPASPAEVAQELNLKFAWKSGAEQFLTLFYALFNTRTRELTYVSAGHPGAILIRRGAHPAILDGGGLPIGIGEGYEQRTLRLEPNDRIYLYSDGVTEAMNPAREPLGRERLIQTICTGEPLPLDDNVSELLHTVKQWEAGVLSDDISILAMECE